MHSFNSQEKQLKAGRGLTCTQWSKIDERHPVWTNHSTEGEASRQTWKVQEAMTGLMVWKMLLMNEEKRLWLCLYPLLFTLLLGTVTTWDWNQCFCMVEGMLDGYMSLQASINVRAFLLLYSNSSPLMKDSLAFTRFCSSKLAVASADIKSNVIYTKWFHAIFFNLFCVNYYLQAVNYFFFLSLTPPSSVGYHFGSNEQANETSQH